MSLKAVGTLNIKHESELHMSSPTITLSQLLYEPVARLTGARLVALPLGLNNCSPPLGIELTMIRHPIQYTATTKSTPSRT